MGNLATSKSVQKLQTALHAKAKAEAGYRLAEASLDNSAKRAEMEPLHGMKAIPNIISCQSATLSLPLVFNPGEKSDYSINIDWVGKAVERAVRCSATIWRSICLSRSR